MGDIVATSAPDTQNQHPFGVNGDVWVPFHSRVSADNSIESLIDLAVFAEKYHICHLQNQISDTIRTALSEELWKPTPDNVWTVYAGVPAKSILRRLCSLG